MPAISSLPLGATLPDCAGRKPSEIPSGTRSVSAFLPGTVSVGPRSFGTLAAGRQGRARSSRRWPPLCHTPDERSVGL